MAGGWWSVSSLSMFPRSMVEGSRAVKWVAQTHIRDHGFLKIEQILLFFFFSFLFFFFLEQISDPIRFKLFLLN